MPHSKKSREMPPQDLSLISSGTGDEPCEICNKCEHPNFFCIDCGLTFCKDCWSEARAHAPGKVNRDGMPHEMINKQVASRLREIFTPSSDPQKQRMLHETDAGTTWFGVTRNITGSPVLQDYGRYSTIMRESSTGEYPQRWPQLVSFVGQTGAGKSTLVKILVDYQERIKKIQNEDDFPSPVAGSINDHAPTSGDVHLYADPGTYRTQFPLLYADCEGMDGGEKIPMGAQYKHNDLASPKSRARSGSLPYSSYGFPRKLRKLNKAVKREIRWANTPEKCKREFAVRNLYPRLLYAFSDIVIFVLRNDRIFESAALVPMLQWAASSIEGSVNQSAMPHAIIVLNFTDPNIDPNGWTVESATNSLLNTYAKAVYENADVRNHANYWQKKGRPVATTKDLLLCYYSSVNVVRIPQKGRYGLVDNQVAELNHQIQKRCLEARENRRRLRIIFNAEEFQAALSMGFDHFSNRLDEPFDFVELSWTLNPIPKDFGGNILRLALAIKDDPKMANASGREIFQHLGHMVASCVMLDYVRHQIKGTASRLLLHYQESYNRALKEFCEDWWPCGFELRGSRCVNTLRGHLRGHQDNRGRVISSGVYRSANDFTEMNFAIEWHAMLNTNLEHIREQMDRMITGEIAMEEETAAEDLHLKRMNEFYCNLGDLSTYVHHAACFCCLRELPEHPLPCGHVLCTACVKSFARKKNRVAFAMDYCPLHEHHKWDQEWEIPVKPHLAGVRILTLDGGGMRGIVELQVLAEIQRHLGPLPIANFFDLIVGTSTGGLVALGLGVKNWSVDSCTKKFENLVFKAFTPREFNGVPLFEQLATLNHKGKYKTKPFREALKESFNDDQLFGGVCEEARYQRKVAVVSTSETGQRAVILTNYTRLQRDAEPDYTFERPEKGYAELKIWEACRATSAATGYFKPFCNDRTGFNYIDGALYYNNPIRVANQERKLLWPDVESQPPDIILSIGTSCTAEAKAEESKWTSWMKPKWFQVAINRFDNILDAQNAWDQFYYEVREPNSTVNHRYIRLNPEVKTKVKLDDLKSFYALKGWVKACLQSTRWRNDTRAVANRLIASSFFFEKDPNNATENSIQGCIHCRFPDESLELRLLGKHFQELQSTKFSPHFLITEQHQEHHGATAVISKEVITAMIQESTFNIEKLTIRLSSKLAKTTISLCISKDSEPFPISGFPRHLVTEELTGVAVKQAQNQSAKRYGSVKRNTGNSSTLSTDSAPSSLLNTPSQIPGGEVLAPPETPIEDIPSWARGRLKRKSFNSLRRGNPSQSTQARTKEHNLNVRAKSSEERRPREPSSTSLPETPTPDMVDNRPSPRDPHSTSEPRLHSSFSMRVMGHGRDVSTSSTPQPKAPEILENTRRIRKVRSLSLQFPPSSSSSGLPIPPPEPTPNGLTSLQSMGHLNGQHSNRNVDGAGLQHGEPMVGINIESMTEEQMVEMAIRESTAAPQIPAYEPLNNDSINTFLSDGMVYTTNPSQSRGLPNMGEYEMPQRTTPNTRPEVFPSAPTINVPREESQFNAELPDVNFQAHGPSRLRNLAGMTEEEMLEMAIAESMRTY